MTTDSTEPRLLGLRPRPQPDPEVVAVAAAAVEQLSRESGSAPRPQVASTAWKYSGRWFSGHQVRLRGRPG